MAVQHIILTDEQRQRRRREAAAQTASALMFVVLAESGETFDPTTLGEHAALFEEWAFPVNYRKGQIRLHAGILYRCLKDHTSQADWTPDVAVSLWVEIADPADEWPPWAQPIGAHDAYMQGDRVTHKDRRWRSTHNGNVWEPGVYGWTES